MTLCPINAFFISIIPSLIADFYLKKSGWIDRILEAQQSIIKVV